MWALRGDAGRKHGSEASSLVRHRVCIGPHYGGGDRCGVVRVERLRRGGRRSVAGGVLCADEAGLPVERAQARAEISGDRARGLRGEQRDAVTAAQRVGVVMLGARRNPPDARAAVERPVGAVAAFGDADYFADFQLLEVSPDFPTAVEEDSWGRIKASVAR